MTRTADLLRKVFVASRPISWPNTAFPFAAAYFLTAGVVDWKLVVGTLFFLIPYNAAMYGTNDVFDYESDLRNPRKGGVEGAVLDPSLHRPVLYLVWGSCVPFVIALVLGGGPWSWVVLAVSLFAVAAYRVAGLRFKEKPVLDSITSSTHFVSPALYGLVLAGWAPGGSAVVTPDHAAVGVSVLCAFFLWGMASHAFGAIQDILPDRAAGIDSIGTLLGSRVTLGLVLVCYTAAGVVLLVTGGPARWTGLLAIPYLLNVAPYLGVRDETSERTRPGWRRFLWLNYLTGFAVTLTMIGLSLGV